MSHGKLQSGALQNLLSLLDVGALEPYDHRDFQSDGLGSFDNTVGHDVTAHDAAENIDEDGSYISIGDQNMKCVSDLICVGPASNVQEVCGGPAGQLDDVHRRHGQPCPVDHAGNVPFQPNVVDPVA